MPDSWKYQSFSFTFEGSNEISASLLGLSLSNLSYIVHEIGQKSDSYEQCELKVSSFQKGSFEILFTTAILAAGQISALYSPQDLNSIVNVLKGIFDIKQLLKGDRPRSVSPDIQSGYIHVTSPDGSSVWAPTGSNIVISNPVIDRKTSEIAQAVHQHNPSGGFRLADNTQAFSYNSQAIADIALPAYTTQNTSESLRSMRAALPIVKVDLLGNSSWSFKFCERTISAKICDQEFLKSVHSGQTAYKAGDMLDVCLTIITTLSPDGIPLKDAYQIDQVYGIQPSPEQLHF